MTRVFARKKAVISAYVDVWELENSCSQFLLGAKFLHSIRILSLFKNRYQT